MKAMVLALAIGSLTAPAFAENRRAVPTERFFNVQWRVERGDGRDAAVVGSLDNHYLRAVSQVLLQVQVLDGPRTRVSIRAEREPVNPGRP